MNEAKMLVGAEVASVFLVDASRQELYSSVNSTGVELRIPIGAGIAGHVAMTGETVIIDDAYADARFNKDIDRSTGFRTRTILCAPLTVRKGGVIGAVQLINKTSGSVTASGGQERGVSSHSRPEAAVGRLRPGRSFVESSDEGSCFTEDDSHFLQVFASQAATAVVNSDAVRDLDKPHLQTEQPELPPTAPASEAEADGLETAPVKAQPACKKGEQALSVPQEAATLLEQSLDGWDLDVARLAWLTDNRPLSSLGCFLLDRLGLVARFGLDREKVSNFFLELERGYDEAVQYHNRAHAASVLHLTYAALRSGSLAQKAAAALQNCQSAAAADGALEAMACLLAAACHDYEHPGHTNDFLVKTGHERAVRYNDSHVNENHHAAAAFALLQRPGLDFLAALPQEELRRFRGLFLELILGTDMSSNQSVLGSFEAALEMFTSAPAVTSQAAPEGGDFVPGSPEEAVLLLQVALKGADLGHLTLGRAAHLRFVVCLEQEFFAQGDREKALGLPASFLMDRDKPGPSSSQVGFFEFVALPMYRTLARACPALQPMLTGAEDNYRYWKNIQGEAE
jgi:cAMP-specific phosphodiesterase 4/high affinity cAMP-specific and IBMX-insensitive 3',5'-cyclic phosphodiesterase 8